MLARAKSGAQEPLDAEAWDLWNAARGRAQAREEEEAAQKERDAEEKATPRGGGAWRTARTGADDGVSLRVYKRRCGGRLVIDVSVHRRCACGDQCMQQSEPAEQGLALIGKAIDAVGGVWSMLRMWQRMHAAGSLPGRGWHDGQGTA
jgi:hypothetical protein